MHLFCEVSQYQKTRAFMATLFHAADISAGTSRSYASERATNAVREAEALLAELGIVDPDTVVQD